MRRLERAQDLGRRLRVSLLGPPAAALTLLIALPLTVADTTVPRSVAAAFAEPRLVFGGFFGGGAALFGLIALVQGVLEGQVTMMLTGGWNEGSDVAPWPELEPSSSGTSGASSSTTAGDSPIAGRARAGRRLATLSAGRPSDCASNMRRSSCNCSRTPRRKTDEATPEELHPPSRRNSANACTWPGSASSNSRSSLLASSTSPLCSCMSARASRVLTEAGSSSMACRTSAIPSA